MSSAHIWESIKNPLIEEIGASSYETWFSSLRIVEEEGELVFETPDTFYKNWIVDHYIKTLERLTAHYEPAPRIKITVAAETDVASVSTEARPQALQEKRLPDPTRITLNSRFSFNNFVVGSSNRFAFAACQAVAESPAKSYNPLFLYSHVGLGKTHLMQSIAHEIKTRHPALKCSYLSSETFTNELINVIRHRSTEQFREKYRNIDV